MKTINIAICEDNKLIQEQLYTILTSYYQERNIKTNIDIFNNGKHFLENERINEYSFILMDIDLEDSNGFEIVEKFRKVVKLPIPIVFITGFEDYKSKAIPLHIFDYIIKPFKQSDIINLLDELSNWIVSNPTDIKKIPFKTHSGLVYLAIDNIIYFAYINRKINIILQDEKYFMSDSIKNLVDKLAEYDFHSPHSAYVVNLRHIKRITPDRIIIMDNDDEIPIAQKRFAEFKKIYFEYIEKTV